VERRGRGGMFGVSFLLMSMRKWLKCENECKIEYL
jgi:hypothetical protein